MGLNGITIKGPNNSRGPSSKRSVTRGIENSECELLDVRFGESIFSSSVTRTHIEESNVLYHIKNFSFVHEYPQCRGGG